MSIVHGCGGVGVVGGVCERFVDGQHDVIQSFSGEHEMELKPPSQFDTRVRCAKRVSGNARPAETQPTFRAGR